jgi:serine/threonine protein kinase
VLVAAFDLDREDEYDQQVCQQVGPDDSSGVFVEPFSRGAGADSQWDEQALSSTTHSVAVADQCCPGQHCTELGPFQEAHLGRFRVLGVLGEGQHATVYRAYDRILERSVALKVPRQGVLKTAKAVERFLGEAKALARLRHPHIVPVYEAGRAGDRHYIAMALIEGHNLAEQSARGRLGIRRATEIVADLAEALAYAHLQGVVHRDVKPANVRLDAAGVVYLMDFGIAYRPDSGEVALADGSILGTPAYVAPEQAQGGQIDALPASDQYSLGVVLYELLCGRPPFCGPPSYVLFHTIHHEPPPLHTFVSKIPRSLSAICLKAMAKRPERRYPGCQEFAADLRRWLGGETPVAHPHAWSRRKR